VQDHVIEEHGTDSWRFHVVQFLHQRKVQYFLLGLLILDVFILFVEVTLLAMYPTCDIIVRDAISCGPAEDGYNSTTIDGRFLAKAEDICPSNDDDYYLVPQFDYPAGCDSHKWKVVHQVEEGLFVMTMIILSCFFVELNVLMVVLQPAVFFRQLFYLMDYVIIGVSLALELFFFLMHEHLSTTLVGMLVVFRSWRYVRISHGIMEVTAELAEQKFGRLLNYTEHLEKILREQGTPLPEDHKVEKLRTQEVDLLAQVRRHHAEEKRLLREQSPSNDDENGGGQTPRKESFGDTSNSSQNTSS
jgi:hypothetical protein